MNVFVDFHCIHRRSQLQNPKCRLENKIASLVEGNTGQSIKLQALQNHMQVKDKLILAPKLNIGTQMTNANSEL